MHQPLRVFALALAAFCLTGTAVASAVTDPAVTSYIINTTGYTGASTDASINAVVSTIPADVQRLRYNATDVFVNSTGVPAYTIGPWLDGNPAVATDRNWLFRIPRSPQDQVGTKTATPLGPIGVWVNGVAMFNPRDAHSYNDAGVWNQNAVINEAAGMDAALGHPAPVMGGGMIGGFVVGIYHHHQQPVSLRAALDDDGSAHSPILGFAFDGFPVYGPYGFANPDGSGGVVRMESSYQLRSGTRPPPPDDPGGSYDGTYVEDYEYVSGLGDLDEYNGHVAVTPEYPAGIYHYHVTIDAGGNSAFPYVLGPSFYGQVAADNLTQTVSVPADAVDFLLPIPVAGAALSIKNRLPDDESKNKVVVKLKDSSIAIGTPASDADPRVGGAQLSVVSQASGQMLMQSLPAANWTLIGTASSPKGYKYKDRELDDGPCKTVVIKAGKSAKASCTGRGPSVLDYDLTGATEEPVDVELTTGADAVVLCARFGGEIQKDGSDARSFKAKKASAPAACP